ncbi:glycoside hydrolase family 79 protein [Calocera viscosa TUFC12733]|uniref:Glycoside hydrolase family 79 protein n=1 Tax=Calocera viscosa (strain TUFC12733) TaxID=1330018 RepID=A0A167JFM3_CALVF|nr:glycoside hydrolase family 79 protein [Calocera viscosa TUFC12733]
MSLLLLLAASAGAITLPIPTSPPATLSAYLSPSFASFSIEFAFFPTFFGNASAPNPLSLALVQHITDRAGEPPSFRPGGITVDSSVYDPSVSGIELDESPVRPSLPSLPKVQTVLNPRQTGGIYRTTYGPVFFQSLALLDNRTQFVFDLNFGNDSLDIALSEAQAAFQAVPASQLWAFELGNEPDQYSSEQRDTSTWDAATYTTQWVNWTSSIQQSLGIDAPRFVALGAAEDPTSSALITTVDVVADGITAGNTVKAFSQHMYQYSTCDPVRDALATLPNLINHANITAYVDEWKPQIAAATSVGVPFIVGEFNSVSCSGKADVTDTFGQALWIADTMLYGASVNISKMFLHQGAVLVFQSASQANTPGFSHYDTWLPVYTSTAAAGASPSYVAFLLLAEAIGASSKSRIAPLTPPGDLEASLGAYAIWDDALNTTAPSRLVLLNMDIFNLTSPSPRPAVTVDLTPLVGSKSVTLKRMTAPGLDEKDATAVTWAGQQFANGTAVGQESVETVAAGNVSVSASEGVLVFLAGNASAAGGNGTSTSSGGSGGSGSSGGQTSGARRQASIFGWWRS